MRPQYKHIARVVKAHGRTGEVVAIPVDGLPCILRAGMHVAIVPPQLKRDRFFTIEGVSNRTGGQLLSLSGVTTIADAESLVGRHILVQDSDLPSTFSLYDSRALVGREVVDVTRGSLGTISEVIYGPANDIWAIQGSDGELLMPVVEHLLVDVPDAGPITVDARDEDLVKN